MGLQAPAGGGCRDLSLGGFLNLSLAQVTARLENLEHQLANQK